jgi:hypothetical protein
MAKYGLTPLLLTLKNYIHVLAFYDNNATFNNSNVDNDDDVVVDVDDDVDNNYDGDSDNGDNNTASTIHSSVHSSVYPPARTYNQIYRWLWE